MEREREGERVRQERTCRHATSVHDGVSKGSAHRKPECLAAALIPDTARAHRHGDGSTPRLIDQDLATAKVTAACKNSLALLGLVRFVILGKGVRRDGSIGVAPSQNGA